MATLMYTFIAVEVSTAADNSEVDCCLVEQYNEQINGFKFDLFDISHSISSLDGNTTGPLNRRLVSPR